MFYYEISFEKSCVRHNSIILVHGIDYGHSEFQELVEEACANISGDTSLPNKTFKAGKYLIENYGLTKLNSNGYADVNAILEKIEEDHHILI